MKNNKKLLLITIFALALIIIPNLLMIDQRGSDIFVDKNNLNPPENPKESFVYYEDTDGTAHDVYISGNYAYIADWTGGLAIIDISNPKNPGTPIYRYTADATLSVCVSGDYAYLGTYNGLTIIDISDPTDPGTPIDEDTTGYAYDVYISGDYAYIADGGSGLAVIDISDPTNPGKPIYEDTSGLAFGIYVDGDHAYVADGDSGLAIIDISDPTNPGIPVYEDTNGSTADVFVSGDYAYIADFDSGLAVIDISDPTNPGTPIYENTSGFAYGVYVDGDHAYIADGDSGLAVIDISDPTNPGIPVYEDTTGFAYDLYTDGNYAYVADYDSGLAVIDISEPIDPEILAYGDTTGIIWDVYVSGDYAYIADDDSGLTIINISDPTNPGTPVYMDTNGHAEGVFIDGDYAYIADQQSGLAIIDISDPTNPGTPIYVDTTSWARDVYISGDYAYVADFVSGLAVINISDPTNPGSPVYEAIAEGSAHGVYVNGDYAYMAIDKDDATSFLAIINISDPTNPGTPVYENITAGHSYDVCISGDWAYIAGFGSNHGLAIINISDPNNPGTPVYCATIGAGRDVYISGDFAYVADGSPGLAVINISDPTNPGTPVYEDTFGSAVSVFVSGDYAYLGASGRFEIIKVRKRIDMTNPVIIDYPTDFFVDYDYTGVNISWTATDQNPNVYTIELQGFGIVAGPSPWSNGTPITYNVPDGLAVGDYIYTINFTDDYNHFATHTATMTVQDTINPIIIDYPTNFSIESGYTGVTISWTATDPNPNTYTIELQGFGIVAGPSPWSNGTPITYNVPDGLTVGEYIYMVNFTDDYGHFATHAVAMFVQDTTDPIVIDAPTDFSVESGYTGITISWTATDPNPNTYTIELQGIGIVAGPSAWSNGTAITYNVPDGLAVGDYIYMVNFTDNYGHYATHAVAMFVQDTTDPIVIDAPTDFSVESGYTGVTISWTATDPNPNTYTIELQGTGMVVGPTAWSSGTVITYNVPDGLAVGEYLYTVNFTDEYGNFITHTVNMTVREAINGEGEFPFELIILTSAISVGAVIVVAIVLIRRKRKLIQ